MRKCRRMRKPKKKINKYWHTMDICGHVDFGYDIRCKRMRERERETEREIGTGSNITGVSL
jgi:hypothetical protein